jgi:hypothetical protein
MIEDDLDFEKSNDKKISSSNNNFTISQSGGFDGTVDSNALERYNYIEPVEKGFLEFKRYENFFIYFIK